MAADDIWWEEASDGDTPSNAVVCGYDFSGQRMYIGRGFIDGDLVPGEIRPAEHCCYLGNNGIERAVTFYEVLVCDNMGKYEWVQTTDGIVPSDAVVGGKISSTGEELYVGRGTASKEVGAGSALLQHGGKVQASHGCFYYTQNGKEHSLTEYDVLCKKSMQCALL